MAVTITRAGDSATSVARSLLLPDDVSDESRNIEKDLLSGEMAITLVTPRPGTGNMTLLYPDEVTARAGRALHRSADHFSLVDSENAARNMSYALGQGGLRLGLDPQTQGGWLLTVSYREVEL